MYSSAIVLQMYHKNILLMPARKWAISHELKRGTYCIWHTFQHLFSHTGNDQYHSHFLITVDHLENDFRVRVHFWPALLHVTYTDLLWPYHTHRVQSCSRPWKCWLFQSMRRRNGMMWNWNGFCKEENVFSDKADLCSHWGTQRCNASSQGLNQEAQGCEHKLDHLVTKNRTWCIMDALKKK